MATAIGELLALPLAMAGTAAHDLQDGLLTGAFACYNLYRCQDERWVAVGALEPKFWARLCFELDREDLTTRQFSGEPDQSLLKETVATIFQERDAREWISLLGEKDCCVTPVRTLEEASGAGQFKSYDVGAGARLSDTPAIESSGLRPPALGEHVAELKERLQMSQECFSQLKNDGVIG
jgi:alpha-methylacyl-CoA racemase